MNSLSGLSNIRLEELTTLIARQLKVPSTMVMPFVDGTHFLTEALNTAYQPGVRLVCAGVATPELEQAADLAQIELTEQLGVSPFASDLDGVLRALGSTSDVIFVANPNRITGAHFSIKEIEQLAQAVPDGLVVVDEHYHEFFGVSAVGRLDKYPNMMVLRSFTAPFSIRSAEAGYVVANEKAVAALKETYQGRPFSSTLQKTVLTTLQNQKATTQRLTEIHEESLRLSTTLNRMGIQSRICATDFLLVRVANPASTGNYLAAEKVTVENLDGYPQMRNYLRYQIQSPVSNDRTLAAFNAMPSSYWRMGKADRAATRLVGGVARPSESNSSEEEQMMSGATVKRDAPGWLNRVKQAADERQTVKKS